MNAVIIDENNYYSIVSNSLKLEEDFQSVYEVVIPLKIS
jgi:hypothetical protein